MENTKKSFTEPVCTVTLLLVDDIVMTSAINSLDWDTDAFALVDE